MVTLFYQAIDTITEADLHALVGQTLEAKTIEYKAKLLVDTSGEKNEFLADVSSFANAIGGDLILGMDAIKGIPQPVAGLPLQKNEIDGQVTRLNNIIQDGVRPRIPVAIQPIELQDGNYVIIIRVWKGFAPPHQITFNKDYRFYTRDSNGKRRLDVEDLRSMFDLASSTAERIKNFRADRLASIAVGETPVPLNDAPKIVLHLIPLGAFEATAHVDIGSLIADRQRNFLQPLSRSFAFSTHHNFDDFVRYAIDKSDADNERVAYHYVQLFRNGIIESVDASLIRKPIEGLSGNPHIRDAYENALVDTIPRNLEDLQKLGVEPPILIMLSILGVKGYIVSHRDTIWSSDLSIYPIHKDNLIVPDVQIDSYNRDVSEVLKPIFDMIANASGYEGSLNYDEAGKWRPVA